MRRLLPVAAALAFVLPIAAQSTPQSDTIPKELVTLLLRGPGMGSQDNFDIRIGAPGNFPKELLPDGATAAVSTVSERATTVVAEAPQLTDDLRAYQRKVESAGWLMTGSMTPRGGLVSSTFEAPLMFCQGDRYASIYLSNRPAGGRYARILLTTDPRRGSCQPVPRYGGPQFFADVTLPRMLPPEGSRGMAGAGSSMGSDHFEQRLRLQTPLEPAAVARHYADQLARDGWKIEGRGDGQGFAIARLTKSSDLKEVIVANIIVNAMPGGDLDVSFRLMRTDPNRRMMPVPGGGVGVRIGGLACCAP